jgi:hypothetical protein
MLKLFNFCHIFSSGWTQIDLPVEPSKQENTTEENDEKQPKAVQCNDNNYEVEAKCTSNTIYVMSVIV